MAALLLGLALVGLPAATQAMGIELITATDPAAAWTQSTETLTSSSTGSGADAVVLPGTSLGAGATLHLELVRFSDSGFTFGSVFEGTAPTASPDLWIQDSLGNFLITANLLSISATGLATGPAGSSTTSVTLGGFDPAQSDLVLTGGSMADNFGGIGAIAELSILLNDPSKPFGFGTVFNGGDFTAAMNVQLQFHTPEPGTFTLVALPLIGLAVMRRKGLRI